MDNSSNRTRCSVNPLLTPLPFGLFKSNKLQGGGGGVIEPACVLEKEGLFNLVKMVVSALHKELECKVEKLNRGS